MVEGARIFMKVNGEFFKQMWKDNGVRDLPGESISSLNERALRFKSYMIFWWICTGTIVAVIFISSLIGLDAISGSDVLAYIGAVPCILAIICTVRLFSLRKRISVESNLTCEKCGIRFRFGDNVGYRVLSTRAVTASSDTKATATYYAKIEIECICEKCGTEKLFTEELKIGNSTVSVGKYTSGANSNMRSIEKVIREYFAGIV